MESKLPKTLNDLAAMDKLIKGAYVDLPDRSAAWFVESVQKLADEVYTVNHRNDVLFTGFENVVVYFDVRSFAEVLREILTHRVMQIANGKPPTEKQFWQAQSEQVQLRAKLELAYSETLKKRRADEPVLEVWMFSIAAYSLYVIERKWLADILSMSSPKLARKALEVGQAIEAKAEQQGEVAYFFPKR
jgi:hypothetical protein